MTEMTTYYQERAAEYERIYSKPERQDDLTTIRTWLADEARGRNIFEVACGTGYWTAVAASAANSVLATDYNEGPLEIAAAKDLGRHVEFQQADAYALPDNGGKYDLGMAHFWWSHVPIADQARFLTLFASHIAPGGRIVMIDNNYVEGSSTPISRKDAAGNTYQTRTLSDGSTYEVLKNFPSTAELERSLSTVASRVTVTQLTHFWMLAADLP